MKRLFLLGSVLALGAAAGLSIHLVTATGSAARSGAVTLRRSTARPSGFTLTGRKLLRPSVGPQLLSAPASAPLVGSLGPVGSASAGRAYLAYNTWRWAKSVDWQKSLDAQGIHTGDPLGYPTLHVRDLRTNTDTPLEAGTFSATWRSDGALAYVRGTTAYYPANTPYLRDVIVRTSAKSTATVWSSSPDRYLIQGWANRRLIVRRDTPGGPDSLLLFEGPGSSRLLADGADLLAISPEGKSVLVADDPASTISPAVRLVAVADGRELARLPYSTIVDPVERAPITSIGGPGHWSGDRVVVTASSGLVVFRFARGQLSVEQVLHIDAATRPEGGFYEPRFAGQDTRTIVAWAYLPDTNSKQSAQFVCDRYARTCTQGASIASTAAPRPVYDESGGSQ